MLFRSDKQRKAMFAKMNGSMADRGASFAVNRFAVDPIKKISVERTSAGVRSDFPVGFKRYYDGRIYIYPGEAYTIKEKLKGDVGTMNRTDAARAQFLISMLGADIKKYEDEGKAGDGMIFIEKEDVDFIEKDTFGAAFSKDVDPIVAYEVAEDVMHWEAMDEESSGSKPRTGKKHKFELELDEALKSSDVPVDRQRNIPIVTKSYDEKLPYIHPPPVGVSIGKHGFSMKPYMNMSEECVL
jgi:hypothetical protein